MSWLRARGIQSFGWQDDYGAFSVSPQHVDRVIGYIKKQKVHHREETFAEEYRGILRQSGGLDHKVDVHLVFSTKNRIPFLADKAVRQRLHDRLAEICETLNCPSFQVGGIEDHVHILYRLSQGQTLAQVAQEVKKSSSTWLAIHHRMWDFDWQDGYGAFSVSPQHVAGAIRYIQNQEEHHREETFEDECGRMFRRQLQAREIQPQSPG